MKTTSSSSVIKNPTQKTVAILQITRFGDLIQTHQAVTELKKLYPNYRIVLIARSQFSRPLNFLLKDNFDEVYHIDTKTMFSEKETKGLTPSLNSLNSFLNSMKSESIDVLINLSFSKSSCYLASLISSNHKIGPFYDFNNRLVINDKWSQMLYATVMRGSLNPYSLVDLFKNIIGIKESSKKANLSIVREEKKKNVIVHPFASQERKMWKTEKWVEVIYKTLKENESYTVTLVGAKNESLKSQLIVENPLLKTFSNRIVNLTGKTNLEELYKEIQSSILFVGHDSMVGHMAALTNTTTLTISLGSVRPYETTPYHSNAYNLSPKTKCFPCFPSDNCSYFQCHHDIPYQVINSAIKEILANKELNSAWIKNNVSSFHMSSINLHKSQIVDGRMKLTSLTDSTPDTSDIFRTLYRITWSFIISEQEESSAFPKLSNQTHQDLLGALNGLQHLYELSDFGKRYSRYILEEIASQTPSVIKIKEFSKKIDEIDTLQKLVQKTSPELAPIIDYYVVRKGNLHGDNIVKLTESSYSVFEECGDLCRVLYELIENSISEYKNSNKTNSVRADSNK
jgi:ADP-heptose:LPS heptosyltransferase